MTHGHLADDRLLDLCLGASPTADDQAHLACCVPCETRRLTFVQVLDDATAAASAEADLAFPPDRLARQQSRILQRLECDSRPGRIIAFPAGYSHEPPVALPVRRSQPWIAAAAAAAGLTIGLLTGYLADLPGRAGSPPPPEQAASAAGPLRPAVLSDDEFLGQVELAVGSSVPAMLSPLNALTPSAPDGGR